MEVRECLIADVLEDFLPLAMSHFNESPLQRKVPFKPDWPSVFRMNAQRHYRSLFLFSNKGALIGYLFFFILPSLHTSTIVATHDIFFVRKDWRIGRGAYLLLQAADRVFQEAGVTEVFSGHQSVDKIDSLMKRFGYANVGALYYKAL